jgi:hypothetical protein
MNAGRLAMTAVVAMVADMIYGFLVFGMLLASSFDQYPGVYRGSADTSHLGYLALGVLIIMFPAVFIYAKGYEGKGAVAEGLAFGCVMGTIMVGMNVVYFAILNIGRSLALKAAAASFVEYLVVGLVIGLVANLPAPAKARAAV